MSMLGLLGSLGSSLIGGYFGSQNNANTNSANVAIAQANNQTAENIANKNNFTAGTIAANNNAVQLASAQDKYQWTVADLQKAGLNPMLAYTQGAQGVGSLSTPALQAPSLSTPTLKSNADIYQNMGDSVGKAINDYFQRKNTEANTAKATADAVNTQADTQNKIASASNIDADTRLKNQSINESVARSAGIVATTSKTNQDTATSAAQQSNYQADTQLKLAQIPKISQEIETLATNQVLTTAQADQVRANIPLLLAQRTEVDSRRVLNGLLGIKAGQETGNLKTDNAVQQVQLMLRKYDLAGAYNQSSVESSGIGAVQRAIKGFSPFIK